MADGFGLWSKWGRWSLSMSDFINKYCVYENWGFMVDGFGVNGVDSRLLMSDFINSSESENWVSWQMGLDFGVNGVDGR